MSSFPSLPARLIAGARTLRRRLGGDRGPRSHVLHDPHATGTDAEFVFKRVSLVVNPKLLEETLGSETLICCGAARGMTSVAAYTLFEQGYFLGERLQHLNFEDVDMREAMPPRQYMWGPLSGRPDFARLVAERNATYERWGFKIPHAVDHVEELVQLLRNPVVMLCVRNPVGTGKSMVRRSETDTGGIEQITHAALRWVPALQFLIRQKNVPSIICDMDIVRRRPMAFVRDLSETLGLEGDHEAIAKTLSNAGYKKTEPKRGMTFVDNS
ncbi:hypothetical protein [Roseivivax sediminis]|uniref:Sulfotransferase family protein n=1 Tax=Roseivivax sediminis TaxID=936889 RepID=A0A1I1WZ82_9RHOB|nr:hypothetical protein [Roseivivax sediminis]SFD98763.1 hypothetical protein SAMN04515678_105106 [Roseivivax sediminis]